MELIRKTKKFGVSFYVMRMIFLIKISFSSLDSKIIMAFERAVLNQLVMNGKGGGKKGKLFIPGTPVKGAIDVS